MLGFFRIQFRVLHFVSPLYLNSRAMFRQIPCYSPLHVRRLRCLPFGLARFHSGRIYFPQLLVNLVRLFDNNGIVRWTGPST